jgi:hypothetical protein
MAKAGMIGGAQWRSAPPLAGSYGVDVDSTRLSRAHGLLGLTISITLTRARGAQPRGELARRAGSSATRGRRGVADFLFHFGAGWCDRRRAAVAAGAQLWGRCRQHPAFTSAWTMKVEFKLAKIIPTDLRSGSGWLPVNHLQILSNSC